jgi:hypothetical protein
MYERMISPFQERLCDGNMNIKKDAEDQTQTAVPENYDWDCIENDPELAALAMHLEENAPSSSIDSNFRTSLLADLLKLFNE